MTKANRPSSELNAAVTAAVMAAVVAAEDAVARLDERLATSPIRAGWVARTHQLDACACRFVQGELVPIEDLVLHDAAMDVRSPTAELVAAHAALRARRRIAAAKPGWAMSEDGLSVLRGRASELAGPSPAPAKDAIEIEDETFAAELAAIDALIARSTHGLAGARRTNAPSAPPREPAITAQNGVGQDKEEWDEEGRLATWRTIVAALSHEPPILAAALAAESWQTLSPLQHASWLGTLLVPDLLRQRGKTRAHLLCLNSGLKAVPRGRRSANPTTRLLAWIEAMRLAADFGLRDHDRWHAAKRQLEHRIGRRRSTSRLPSLIDLIIATPIVSTSLIADKLEVTPRAAQMLIEELGLRELTGRGRYRAWGVI